ncbi:MAG: methionyl-tRNA formyltransferase [Patescibacteria group bacterium]
MLNKKIKIGFFGTPQYAVQALKKLKESDYEISLVVTVPDRPKGRKMILTPPPVKVWAEENNIAVFQPEKLKSPDFADSIRKFEVDVFIVLAYGKIIPDEILNIPKHKCLNIHPSLLPKYRGSCPIESAILNDDKNTGVTIIRIDSEMDHGPIIWQKESTTTIWPPTTEELGEELIGTGLQALTQILPDWIDGKIPEIEQDHSKATYTKKIEKEDGLIDLKANPYQNYLKIQAYHGWPSAYFFINKKYGIDGEKVRVKITEAIFKDNELCILKVIPEGKSEINYSDL